MRREPALTFDGALRILGKAQTPGIDKIDSLLGGVILAAGAGLGLAAVGGAALAPAAAIGALWGWIDQKNEATRLLGKAVAALSKKVAGRSGMERRDLVAAAHTTIVAAAFFESLQERVGRIELTETDRLSLVVDSPKDLRDDLLDLLYRAEVPAPSAAQGFEENLPRVGGWLLDLGRRTIRLFSGLDEVVGVDLYRLNEVALERYRTYYIDLAATVPEFSVWASLGEHAATRARIDLVLEQIGAAARPASEAGAAVHRANLGRVREPVLSSDAGRFGTAVTFPTVAQMFVEPRYRITRFQGDSRVADEHWWEERRAAEDLDIMLLGHVFSTEATRVPMLLLGHPGAGKSMLTKILAARLPAENYTVVRVPLRAVGAHAPVLDQIQQGLDLATNRRAPWAELADATADTLRVVLLDGLDELLQASKTDRSGYLREVIQFQQREADQDRPVAVLVTSRTVVADRVDIPPGTTVVKLADFTGEQTADWLRRWHDANAAAIESGTVRKLTRSAAERQPHLARQPLLLMMLALYAADPNGPDLDEDLSITALYDRLFHMFAVREVGKSANPLPMIGTATRVDSSIDRLCVAALAMFNRGSQQVTEAELGTDLIALLDEGAPGGPSDTGQRLLAEFFFVHAAEATDHRRTDRTYEFLHATFGEYLVARKVVDELRNIADAAYGGRRGRRDPDDDLLFALLSHCALAVRRSIHQFAAEMIQILDDFERTNVVHALNFLIKRYRQRPRSSKYQDYRPLPEDHLRRLAAYSANLLLLRAAFQPDGSPVALTEFFERVPAERWTSTVTLWRSGLDADGWYAMLGTIGLVDQAITVREPNLLQNEGLIEIVHADLSGNPATASRLGIGSAVLDDMALVRDDDWYGSMLRWLVAALGGRSVGWWISSPPPDVPTKHAEDIARLSARLLLLETDVPYSQLVQLTRLVVRLLPSSDDEDRGVLAVMVCRYPEMLDDVPQLRDPALYGILPEMADMMVGADPKQPPDAWWDLYEALRSTATPQPGRAIRFLLRNDRA
jgi:hypothetical protein